MEGNCSKKDDKSPPSLNTLFALEQSSLAFEYNLESTIDLMTHLTKLKKLIYNFNHPDSHYSLIVNLFQVGIKNITTQSQVRCVHIHY